jgi:hypothetical protein
MRTASDVQDTRWVEMICRVVGLNPLFLLSWRAEGTACIKVNKGLEPHYGMGSDTGFAEGKEPCLVIVFKGSTRVL